jgi:hypothetical protein
MGAPSFTPGPWMLTAMGGQTLVHVETERVARVFTRNGIANARLIAAAPELYEALSEVVTLLEGWHRLNFADEIQQQGVRLAKRALAKARGEQEPSK